ncbi:PQQ-binding-like beta-propeller repeat protein [Planctomicrobium sp. SH661]|uniref:outer membrane protein assembly factor BamB family protein n=1 Tax=Planctomicrobium sp. SH661 TaxID=3448124 RepID=UPI003F5B9C53
MPLSIRLLSAVAALSICLQSASAQGTFLPDEGELNRLGLTMSWWGQAGVNASRDNVEFFTADEQNVFVQSSTGMLSSFHGELGRKLWTRLVGTPDQQSYPVTTSDQEVLVTIGLHLYSLDKRTGKTQWELIVSEYPSTSPEMDEKQIFVGTLDGSVLAYDLPKVRSLYQRGMLPQWTVRARMWNFQTPDLIISPPIPAGDDVVFASKRGIVYSLKAQSKELKYQLEAGNLILTPLGYSKDKLFVADRNARMLCMNTATGSVIWTFAGGTPIAQQPRAVDRFVYVVPHREGLTSLATASGVQQWQQPVATSFVAASETRVYARDESKNLLVLDRATGKLIGSMNMRNYPIHAANDRTDRIYLSSPGGTVIALREIGSDYPVYHLHPERRPILPELAPEEETQQFDQESN